MSTANHMLLLSNPFALCEVCPGCKGERKQRPTDSGYCVRCDGEGSRLRSFATLEGLREYVAREPVWPSPKPGRRE